MSQLGNLYIVRLSMKVELRKVLAAILAPSIIPMIFSMITGFGYKAGMISAIFTYSGMYLFGIPSMIFLKKINRLDAGYLSLLGVIFGAFVYIIFMVIFTYTLEGEFIFNPTLKEMMASVVIGGLMGFITAFSFSLISGIPLSSGKNTKA